jgi:hypothetical protein
MRETGYGPVLDTLKPLTSGSFAAHLWSYFKLRGRGDHAVDCRINSEMANTQTARGAGRPGRVRRAPEIQIFLSLRYELSVLVPPPINPVTASLLGWIVPLKVHEADHGVL